MKNKENNVLEKIGVFGIILGIILFFVTFILLEMGNKNVFVLGIIANFSFFLGIVLAALGTYQR